MASPEPISPPRRLRGAAPRGPLAPEHFAEESRVLWRSINGRYELEPHHLEILRTTLEARDRAQQARELIDAEGITVEGRYGPRAHPALAIERDARMTMIRGWRLLDLDAEAVTTTMRARKRGGR